VELQNLGNDSCWALIFFCLRSGLLTEAVEYVTTNAPQFRALDRNFMNYITTYASSPERRLPRSMQDRINVEYQQRVRIAPENSLDPYRMACYKIIGRCEISKRTIEGISQGSEDWIWLQFSLAREVNRAEEVAGDVYGLEDVRDTIREIGQRYFTKGAEGMGGYGVYFFLQVLGGMFEQAVSYLFSYASVAAVHFAIALDFYGLLRVSDWSVSENELRKSKRSMNERVTAADWR
jgi:nuclear pore complex protein Nup93